MERHIQYYFHWRQPHIVNHIFHSYELIKHFKHYSVRYSNEGIGTQNKATWVLCPCENIRFCEATAPSPVNFTLTENSNQILFNFTTRSITHMFIIHIKQALMYSCQTKNLILLSCPFYSIQDLLHHTHMLKIFFQQNHLL